MLQFILLIITGIAIGAIDAVVGSGSLLMVSALTFLGLSPLHAIVNMKIATTIQDFIASTTYAAKKLIDWKQAFTLSLFALIGSYLGANIVLNIEEKLLAYISGGLMIALIFFLPEPVEKIGSPFARLLHKVLTRRPTLTKDTKKEVILAILSFLLGIYGGFYGAAVGTLFLTVFLVIGDASLLVTAANTKIITFFISLGASAVFIKRGGVIILDVFLPLTIGTSIGALLGVLTAEKADFKYLRYLLYVVITISAANIILTSA